MIEIKNISKYYGRLKAVDDISFTIKPGEIVGLLGPNGAGKTTLMKIITGYHNAHTGTTKVCNVDMAENAVLAKKHIGYLPETNPLYEDLSVYEYPAIVGRAKGIEKAEIEAAVDAVIKSCAITEFVYKLISSLSKGMKQRVGLAQAIIHNPDVIILDEPTSGLDPNQIKEIRSVIAELGKTKTVILSTHILQEVEILCTRILILNKGIVVAEGTNAEIATKLKGEDTFNLLLVGNIDQEVLQTLSHVTGVSSVVRTKPEEQNNAVTQVAVTQVTVSGSFAQLHGEAIFDWAVSKQIKIQELYKKSASLESVFQAITTDNSGDNSGDNSTVNSGNNSTNNFSEVSKNASSHALKEGTQ